MNPSGCKPLNVSQTPSSTHWQYPPRRSSAIRILWLSGGETAEPPEIMLDKVSIRDDPKEQDRSGSRETAERIPVSGIHLTTTGITPNSTTST